MYREELCVPTESVTLVCCSFNLFPISQLYVLLISSYYPDIMDGKSILSSTSSSSSNPVDDKNAASKQRLPSNGIDDNQLMSEIQPLHRQTSSASPQNVNRGRAYYPSSTADEDLSAEEREIRAACQQRLDNIIRQSSGNVPTVLSNTEQMWPAQPTRSTQQFAQNVSPVKPSNLSSPPIQGLTTDRTKRRLSASFKSPGSTTWGAGMVRPATNPDFGYGGFYPCVGPGPAGSRPTSVPQTPSGLSPVESMYSIDQNALFANRLRNTAIGRDLDSSLSNVDSGSVRLPVPVGENTNAAVGELDLWSVGSVNAPSDTSAWSAMGSPTRLSFTGVQRVTGTGVDPMAYSGIDYDGRKRSLGSEFSAQDLSVRIPLSTDGSTKGDPASVSINMLGMRNAQLVQPQTYPRQVTDSNEPNSLDQLAQFQTNRAITKPKSVRWACRPPDSPSPGQTVVSI